jgi:catechol 2,3-dioxygenase-like lactoylglutathione lyase family enzyme
MSINVVGIDHIVLNVADVDIALAFYEGILGLEILRLDRFRRGEVGFVSLKLSEHSLIDLRPGERDGANVDHFCLAVDEPNMGALLEQLREQGVRVQGSVGSRWGARGDGLAFSIFDPDGNKIEIKSYSSG